VSAKAAFDEAALPDCVRAIDAEFEFVHRSLRHHGVPAADCEDLAQEVFLVTWRRWRDYDSSRPLRAWLTGIVFRVACDYRRTVHRRVRRELLAELPDEVPTPDHQLTATRARTLVLRALQMLPEVQRRILILHELDGRSIRDLAREESVPLFTMYTRLRRARVRFASAVRRLRGDGRPRRMWLLWPLGATLVAAALVVAVGRPHLRPARTVSLPGLVGHWSFDDPSGSAIARDLSGHGGDCQLHALDPGRAHIAGVQGGALRLLPRGWLSCPQPRLDAVRAELTVAAWARKSPARRAVTSLVTRQIGEARTFTLGFHEGQVIVRSAPWNIELSAPLPVYDRWVHLAFTRQGAVSKLYLDGVEVAASRDGLATPGPLEGELTVGAARFDQEPPVRQRLDGAIDELYTFDRALGPDEIAALARR
jgi:RNA polymerase sigma-70 factor (ECF subfamily)